MKKDSKPYKWLINTFFTLFVMIILGVTVGIFGLVALGVSAIFKVVFQ